MYLVPPGTGGYLLDIHVGNVLEGIADGMGENGQIPERIAKLKGETLGHLWCQLAIVVTVQLLDLLRKLTNLTVQGEGEIG